MDPDQFKQSWRMQSSQTRLTIDADLLLAEVRRNQHYFTAMIFWRDFREVGVCLVMIPLWIYMGSRSGLPWTFYLAVPAVLWVAVYMLVDRMRHERQPPEPGEPLRKHVMNSLAQVEHQIELLRNVHWWYLMPLALAYLAFVGQVTWQERSGGWWTALAAFLVLGIGTIVFVGIYWLNQYAVRGELEPRRRELETLLVSLADETPDAG
jgi:hypothetical protein